MQIFNQLHRLWNSYTNFVEVAILSDGNNTISESQQISDNVFLNAIKYGIPLGILVILTATGLTATDGFNIFSLSGITLFVFTSTVSLIGYIKLPIRKLLSSLPLVIIALVSFFHQGTTASGFIYLMLFSCFYALQANEFYATLTILVNTIACLLVLFAILFKLNIGKVNSMDAKIWLIYTFNFIFLNIITVVMIRQTIRSLQQLIDTKTSMGRRLNDEIVQKNALNTSLDATEDRYKKLFHMSPCAQLIIDAETKMIIKVNQAACSIYGYTENEFLSLKLSNLLLPEDHDNLTRKMYKEFTEDLKSPQYYKNVAKSKKLIDTEILWGDIELRGARATLLIVNDVTLKLAQYDALAKQNAILRKIVHIQSHSIRPPLTRIMSLTELIADEYATQKNQILFDYLTISAKELDQLIHEVIKESELILNDIEPPFPLPKD